MDVMFPKSECTYLQTLTAQAKSQELTQELKIPDSMPDIGRVLNCWGQVVVRGKEWKNNGMAVSGGVLIWCLYAPEDGEELRCVDTWIPFQCSWDFQESVRDGAVYVATSLQALDARCISARKMMVRATLDVYGEALEQKETTLYLPENIPEDIYLLRNTYPLEVPEEAGEKAFQIEELLTLPGGRKPVAKLICAKTDPEIVEQRVMTNKLVFRGSVRFSIQYLDDEGNVSGCEWKLPFSQLADLDRDYGNESSAWVMPIVTGQDVDLTEDGQLQYRGGIAVQYVIYDRKLVDVVEDAYSNSRDINLRAEQITIPARLDVYHGQTELQNPWNMPNSQLLGINCFMNIPTARRREEQIGIEMSGQFQALYRDENSIMQGMQMKTENEFLIQSDSDNSIRMRFTSLEDPILEQTVSGGQLIQKINFEAEIHRQQEFVAVSGLGISETARSNTKRPSVILKRVGHEKLWDIAKTCGSSVESITEANELTSETTENRILLIPVK